VAELGISDLSKKERGAFFTPPAIADFLAAWAVRGPDSAVLDPTCGESVFLLSAAERLKKMGASAEAIPSVLTGVDLHRPSLTASRKILKKSGYDAKLIESNFFDLPPPSQSGDRLGWQDAVIGNPPFVRYQEFSGHERAKGLAAALAQGVRLSQLTSSWAPTLVHSSAFLKPAGRLAMVCPAELLTVGYAEPIRAWLQKRFAAVKLVLFERLQFRDAEEQVVLLVAEGEGPCDGFLVHRVYDASDLADGHILDPMAATPTASGKWSDLALSPSHRALVKRVHGQMGRLDDYGTPELGAVTGRNSYFTLSDFTRRKFKIGEKHLVRISPPGTKHLQGTAFSRADWEILRAKNERVWLLRPELPIKAAGLREYLRLGEQEGVDGAYKCSIREPWWRPPIVPVPDILFTYMSHRYPRLIANASGATILNSMHGIRLRDGLKRDAKAALPLLALNSATMVGAEILGRSYGGGILKMEPREAAGLPVPTPEVLRSVFDQLMDRRAELDQQLRSGEWWAVVKEIDCLVLMSAMGLGADEVGEIQDAAAFMRVRRTRQTEVHD
jgi:adenine-specific DNA-methyltransferase